MGELGPKYSTPNGLGYTESKAKSSTPHMAPNEVFRLSFLSISGDWTIFCNKIFNLGMHIDEK